MKKKDGHKPGRKGERKKKEHSSPPNGWWWKTTPFLFVFMKYFDVVVFSSRRINILNERGSWPTTTTGSLSQSFPPFLFFNYQQSDGTRRALIWRKAGSTPSTAANQLAYAGHYGQVRERKEKGEKTFLIGLARALVDSFSTDNGLSPV